jgi:hypothetical protein
MEADYEKDHIRTGNRGLVVSFYNDILPDGIIGPCIFGG